MFNLMVLAARPSDWTHDQFIEWWRGEHAEVTYPLPGLLSWRHTEIVDSTDEKSAGWDGLSILSFESRGALESALRSAEWKAAVEHVGSMRGRRMIWYGDEKTMVPRSEPAS
ncbi:ethyl tert-butyl ether degradation protein EthD [Prescottella equi]|uniref:EthD family reductase n=1 Tax=Rhodococcus hoagii TaxID=43767 RepID=UPI000A11B1E9|nr:EthD family reductase [Prescottella equi]ORJ92549.1 ethyl tert-butyl ether degradation protein EthD [Prescottella equi]